ncbi:recombinase family protein [uncultured Robinsoniella sp.]|uniref:recombinase family protein n=1 Tax=uncultured Robinsoniella sp. TaxID=904190 RepID=UPI00374F4019
MKKAIQGGYHVRPPLGNRINDKGKPPVIVQEETEIERLIFIKYVNEGMSLFRIATYLNYISLKSGHGKAFEKCSLENILQYPTYI